MADYHCGAVMRRTETPLQHARKRLDLQCVHCGQTEMEIRDAGNKLLLWKNVTLLNRLAATETVGV